MAIQDALKADKIKLLALEPPLIVERRTPLREVLERMRAHPKGEAALVVEDRKPVGIFTERDVLLKLALSGVKLSEPIEKYMNTRLSCLSVEDSLGEAVRVMNEKKYRHIPLLNAKGELAGSLTIRDVLNWLAEAFPQVVLNLPPRPHQTMNQAEGG